MILITHLHGVNTYMCETWTSATLLHIYVCMGSSSVATALVSITNIGFRSRTALQYQFEHEARIANVGESRRNKYAKCNGCQVWSMCSMGWGLLDFGGGLLCRKPQIRGRGAGL